MKFSVLINNYNYGRYVGRAIQSVLAQNFGDWEIIVVDDGSTDDSRSVIDSFVDSRIHAIYQTNQGQGAAIMAGIAAASGDAVALLDSDDEWHPEKLEMCAKVLKNRPNCSLVQHGWESIDESGGRLARRFLPVSGDYDALEDYRRLRFDLPFAPSSCVVGPITAFRRLLVDTAEWRIAADTPVIAGLSVLGSCYFIQRPLTQYRLHGTNAEPKNTIWTILERRRRYYDCVNQHLELIGSGERFGFETSPIYLRGQISRTKWYHPLGLWNRLRYYSSLIPFSSWKSQSGTC